MRKQVIVYSDPKSADCQEVENYLTEQEVNFRVHDISAHPLDLRRIRSLVRHLDVRNFLDSRRPACHKYKLDNGLPERDDLLALLAEDNGLLRLPIVVAGRLMTVGACRRALDDMLQLKSSRDDSAEKASNAA